MLKREYYTGGIANFKVSNPTGISFHYRIKVNLRDDKFSSVLVRFQGIYVQIAYLDNTTGKMRYHKNGSFKEDELACKVIVWLMKQVFSDVTELPEGYTVEHNGKCSICSRPLTDIDSIVRGIGPTCLKKIQARI